MGIEVDDPQTNNGALIKALTELSEVESLRVEMGSAERADVLVLPEGKKATSIKGFLDEYRLQPERRKGTARLTSLESFIDHVNRFKDDDSAVFADTANPTKPRLIGVLNYHCKPTPEAENSARVDGQPRFGDHRAEYEFPISDEWIAWTRAKEGMSLQEFAAFLEDHIADVADPSAVKLDSPTAVEAKQLGISLASPQLLMETSRGLTINVKGAVTNAVRLSSGETQVSFKEEHTSADGKTLSVPGGFAIDIPVFRLGQPYRLLVRLRYRVTGAAVAWSFAITRVEKTLQKAVSEACAETKDKTGLPLFYGTPE